MRWPISLGPFGALYRERFLIWQLLLREIAARTSGTVLGGIWLLLQPALQVLAFWFLLDLVFQVRSPGTVSYLDYFLTGMLPWLFFSETLIRSLTVLTEFSPLYEKTRFPIHALPLVPLLLNLGIFAPIYFLTTTFFLDFERGLASVLIMLGLAIWCIPLTYLIAIIGLFIRETRQVFPFLLSLALYATPILYAPDMLPLSLRWLLAFNPLADVIALIQGLLHSSPLDPMHWLRPLTLWLLLLPSWRLFRASEPHIREVL